MDDGVPSAEVVETWINRLQASENSTPAVLYEMAQYVGFDPDVEACLGNNFGFTSQDYAFREAVHSLQSALMFVWTWDEDGWRFAIAQACKELDSLLEDMAARAKEEAIP